MPDMHFYEEPKIFVSAIRKRDELTFLVTKVVTFRTFIANGLDILDGLCNLASNIGEMIWQN